MATTPNNPNGGQAEEPRPASEQEQWRTAADRAADSIANVLHQVWLAGLGAATVVGEETSRVVDSLIEKGRENEPRVRETGRKVGETLNRAAQEFGERVKDVASRIGKRAEAAEGMLDERVRATLERMGYATKNDIDALSAKLDALTSRLEEFASRRKNSV